MKWYIACSGVSLLTGGKTLNASQVSRITLRGCPPMHGIFAFSMYSMGYEPRVFWVRSVFVKSTMRESGSYTTFSSTLPNRIASKISGSFLRLRSIIFA